MTQTRRIFTFVLRLLALAATVSATIVMVNSHDSTRVLNLTFKAKFSDSPTFTYFVIVEAIVSGYNLIILLLSSKGSLWRIVIILDVCHVKKLHVIDMHRVETITLVCLFHVAALLLTSSMSAALTIAQVGKKGNTHAGWLPICGQVSKFCNHVSGALVAGILAAIFYYVLNLFTLYNVLNPLFVAKPN
ncbi:CASP-like protein 1C2 isoform X1 [Malus domestica]|uniref:CASP-like protein 1C2 isoform X1 n=1 Tax=Malus domestica TaxID=3750 RepID=UPI0010AA0542|nr:CASP-like protein 1C2 isoform X1 [Malus domestica]